jgi:hypothetical protein
VLFPTVAVLAVDDPRLVGVEPQAHFFHPRGDPGKHVLGLPPALAVHDSVVGIALKWAVRVVPGHPRIERVVHEQVRQDRRNRRPLRSSLVSLNQGAIRAPQRGSQPPLDVEQHPPAVGDSHERGSRHGAPHGCWSPSGIGRRTRCSLRRKVGPACPLCENERRPARKITSRFTNQQHSRVGSGEPTKLLLPDTMDHARSSGPRRRRRRSSSATHPRLERSRLRGCPFGPNSTTPVRARVSCSAGERR